VAATHPNETFLVELGRQRLGLVLVDAQLIGNGRDRGSALRIVADLLVKCAAELAGTAGRHRVLPASDDGDAKDDDDPTERAGRQGVGETTKAYVRPSARVLAGQGLTQRLNPHIVAGLNAIPGAPFE
jgi:hypothetical protein